MRERSDPGATDFDTMLEIEKHELLDAGVFTTSFRAPFHFP